MSPLPPDVTRFSAAFPFTPIGPPGAVVDAVRSQLPTHDRALFLCRAYLSQAAWLFRGITHAQLVDEMVPAIYANTPGGAEEDYTGPHGLALLFGALSVGALLDMGQDGCGPEAEHYQQLSRAALGAQSVFEKPSVITIQTLHLQSIYYGMAGKEAAGEPSLETSWSLLKLAAQLAYTVSRSGVA